MGVDFQFRLQLLKFVDGVFPALAAVTADKNLQFKAAGQFFLRFVVHPARIVGRRILNAARRGFGRFFAGRGVGFSVVSLLGRGLSSAPGSAGLHRYGSRRVVHIADQLLRFAGHAGGGQAAAAVRQQYPRGQKSGITPLPFLFHRNGIPFPLLRTSSALPPDDRPPTRFILQESRRIRRCLFLYQTVTFLYIFEIRSLF